MYQNQGTKFALTSLAMHLLLITNPCLQLCHKVTLLAMRPLTVMGPQCRVRQAGEIAVLGGDSPSNPL